MNFLGKFVWANGPESSSKVSPYTGIGPWMALPRSYTQWPSLKTLTSLNKEVRPSFLSDNAFGVFPFFLPLATPASGGPEGYFSLAIIALGAFGFIVPKYDYRLGNMEINQKGKRAINLSNWGKFCQIWPQAIYLWSAASKIIHVRPVGSPRNTSNNGEIPNINNLAWPPRPSPYPPRRFFCPKLICGTFLALN